MCHCLTVFGQAVILEPYSFGTKTLLLRRLRSSGTPIEYAEKILNGDPSRVEEIEFIGWPTGGVADAQPPATQL